MKHDNRIIALLTICIMVLVCLILYKVIILKKENKKIITHFEDDIVLIGGYDEF